LDENNATIINQFILNTL